jgi:glycine dehydrogenase subunit 2
VNANYARERVKDTVTLSYPGPATHEVRFDGRFLDQIGVTAVDFVKALIDEGFRPSSRARC